VLILNAGARSASREEAEEADDSRPVSVHAALAGWKALTPKDRAVWEVHADAARRDCLPRLPVYSYCLLSQLAAVIVVVLSFLVTHSHICGCLFLI
jgi:hypothetical protein